MEKTSCRLPLHSRLKTVSRPTAGNIPERVKLVVWSLENYGLPVNVISPFHETFSRTFQSDMILDHKGRLPTNIREFLPKDRGRDVVAQ